MAYPFEGKKAETAHYGFSEIINESKCEPNKLWVDQGREFYNKLVQTGLDNNNILMYSTYNEGKSVIAERFISTLKCNFYKKWWQVIVIPILII